MPNKIFKLKFFMPIIKLADVQIQTEKNQTEQLIFISLQNKYAIFIITLQITIEIKIVF